MTHTISAHNIEHVVTAVIVANAALVVAGLLVDGHEEAFEEMDLAALWFFAAELTVRLAMARLGFFHSLWNAVDAVIILLALLPVAGGGIAVLRVARLARMAHLTRHTTGLRLLVLCRALPAFVRWGAG
jgi:hypothetical protein